MAIKIIIGAYIFILGSIFASFFGVVIGRVPEGKSILKPASHCENCGHLIKWYENIPIISYLILGGKCSKCGAKIGLFSLIFEIIGGLSFLFVYLFNGLNIELIFKLLVCGILLLIAGYDYKTHYVLNINLIILGTICTCYFLYRVIYLKEFWLDYVFSFVLGVVFFLAVMLIGKWILKKDALGSGDVYLVGILGFIYQPFELIIAILIGSLLGSIIEISKIKLNKSERDVEIPFCPYLCFGFYMVLLFGNNIMGLLVG